MIDNLNRKTTVIPLCYYTCGVMAMKGVGFDKVDDDYMFTRALQLEMWDKYREVPDQDLKGGNDKDFFSFKFRGKKLFAVRNEVNGLTIMLPEEY